MKKVELRWGFVSAVMAVVFFVLVLPGCKGPVSPVDPVVTPEVEEPLPPEPSNEELLEKLGINTDKTPPVDGNGQPVTGDMNPLGKKTTVFFKRNEVFQAGAQIQGLARSFAGDFNINSLTPISRLNNYSGAWLDLPKKSVSGDIDGNGLDEIITAVFDGSSNQITIRCLYSDGTVTTKPLGTFDFMAGFGASTVNDWIANDYFERDITPGDFNGDELCDFAISCMTGVLILDHNLNIIGSFTVPDTESKRFVRVEAGDLNNDGYDDLVVVNGRRYGSLAIGQYYIFSGSVGGLGIIENDPGIIEKARYKGNLRRFDNKHYCSGEVSIGDYNGDGWNEISFAGILNEAGRDENKTFAPAFLNSSLTIWDPYNETTSDFNPTFKIADYSLGQVKDNDSADESYHPWNIYVPRLVSGKFQGGNEDMLAVMDRIFCFDGTAIVNFSEQFYGTSDFYTMRQSSYDLIVAGDVTGNGCDDLIFFETNITPYTIGSNSYRRNNEINKLVVWGKNDVNVFGRLLEVNLSSKNQYPTLALANVDDDSPVIQYSHHELVYSSPRIQTILASPPYNEGMEIGNSGTSFTSSCGRSRVTSHQNGFNVGYYIGFEVEEEVPLSGGAGVGFGMKATVNADFSWGRGSQFSTSTSYTYSSDAGFNQVIFSSTPIDVYYYDIVEAPSDYIQQNGNKIAINIPRQPIVNSVDLDFFNSIVPDGDKVPKSIIKHTIGDPHSYYTTSEKDAILASTPASQTWLYSKGTLSVPLKNGTNTITTDSALDDISTYDFTISAGIEVDLKSTWIVGGYSAGYSHGYSLEHVASNGTEVSGTVGYLPEELYNSHNFRWGLMMIPRSFGNQEFNLVTYWVE